MLICHDNDPKVILVDNFYQLWVIKESIVKALGLGFSLPFNQFSVSIRANSFKAKLADNLDYCNGWHNKLPDGTPIALAILNSTSISPEIIEY
jgi:phosphopantetheinyl transferase